MPSLRMLGAIPPLSNMSSWHGAWLNKGINLPENFYLIYSRLGHTFYHYSFPFGFYVASNYNYHHHHHHGGVTVGVGVGFNAAGEVRRHNNRL
jgi:hypothetical protein